MKFSKLTLAGLLTLVFLLKLGETELLTRLDYCQSPYAAGGRWANTTGDSFSYIGAMENYVSTGSYFFINEKDQVVKAGRLPHYAIPYFVLRQVFPPATALDIFVLLQLLLESAAIICLALLAFYLTQRRFMFFVSLVLSVASVYVTVWSYNTFTDAVSANLIVMAVFFYYRHLKFYPGRNFLYFSCLLALITCLRPYFVLVYPLVVLSEWLSNRGIWKEFFRSGIQLALPIVLLLLPWVIRNELVLGRFILFQQDMYAGYGFSAEDLALRKSLTMIGEDGGSWWDRKSAASYFNHKTVTTSKYSYPSYLRSDQTMVKQLEALRYISLDTVRRRSQLAEVSVQTAELYRQRFPLRYYLLNRILFVEKFVVNNGSYHLPVDKSSPCYKPYQYYIKIFQSLLFFLCLIPGGIGLVMLSWRDPKNFIFLLPSVYLILMFPVFLGLTEWRYFLPFYHLHQLGCLYLGDRIFQTRK